MQPTNPNLKRALSDFWQIFENDSPNFEENDGFFAPISSADFRKTIWRFLEQHMPDLYEVLISLYAG